MASGIIYSSFVTKPDSNVLKINDLMFEKIQVNAVPHYQTNPYFEKAWPIPFPNRCFYAMIGSCHVGFSAQSVITVNWDRNKVWCMQRNSASATQSLLILGIGS